MKRQSSAKIVLYVLLTVCTVLTLFFTLQTWIFLNNAELITGRVVSVRLEPPAQYYPSVQYRTADASTHVVESMVAANAAQYHIGDEVQIYVDRRDPANARFPSFAEQWLVALVCAVFALTVVVILLFLRRSERSWKQNTEGSPGRFSSHFTRWESGQDKGHAHQSSESNDIRQLVRARSLANNMVMLRVTWVFIGVGVLLLMAGSYTGYREWTYANSHPTYSAWIVDVVQRGSYQYPVYAFVDAHGDTLQCYSQLGSRGFDYEIGSTHPVIFNERDHTVTETTFFSQYFLSLVLCVIGVAFSGMGLLFRFLLRRDIVDG